MRIFALTILFGAVVSCMHGFRPSSYSSLQLKLRNAPDVLEGQSTFKQIIDHDRKETGTFDQRFWWSTKHWKGPGSPVLLVTPGESSAETAVPYIFTNDSLTDRVAQEIGGAIIILEHRYFGTSSPPTDLTKEALKHLTLNNAIYDLLNFARSVELPFDNSGKSLAKNAPWSLLGGSYAGQLSAWTARTAPDTFWSYHASSAAVQVTKDYWQYFEPIKAGIPKNCSKDLSLVVEHIDDVFIHGKPDAKKRLKDSFGLGFLDHDDDFAEAIVQPIAAFQSLQLYTGYAPFFQFCDAIEGVYDLNDTRTGFVPDANGVGVTKALAAYAAWIKRDVPSLCAPGYGHATFDRSCLDWHNASQPSYTNHTLANQGRTWRYLLCNEPLAFWFDGPPPGVAQLTSRTITNKHWRDKCPLFFPGWKRRKCASVDAVNAKYGGWSEAMNVSRLLWVNGEFDPWRQATVSSTSRPGGPLKDTKEQPVVLIPGGFHVSDNPLPNALVNAGAAKAMARIVATHRMWMDEYYETTGRPRPEKN